MPNVNQFKANSLSEESDILVDAHPSSDTLIIAFTGIAAQFNAIQPFDFFKLTGLYDYHRILVRERRRNCYLKGVDETGFDGLLDRLKSEIQQIAPKQVMVLGTSAGGYAALLFGWLLEADYVHAFSPFTFFDLGNLIRSGDYRHGVPLWPDVVWRLNFLLPSAQRRYLDLRPLLMKKKGETRFYVHACAGSFDRVRAMHLRDCLQTQIFLYPCTNHNVTWGMIKSKCLREMLREENLAQPEKVYRRFYPDFDSEKPFCSGCAGTKQRESVPKVENQVIP
jgi:hypothetical protein